MNKVHLKYGNREVTSPCFSIDTLCLVQSDFVDCYRLLQTSIDYYTLHMEKHDPTNHHVIVVSPEI